MNWCPTPIVENNRYDSRYGEVEEIEQIQALL